VAALFYTKTSQAVGTSNTQVGTYAVPSATQTIVLALTMANITNSAISVSAWYAANNGAGVTVNTAIAYNIPLPAGDTFVVNKVVLQANDRIYVASSAASSVDCAMSILEIS